MFTFICISWIFFRADSLPTAITMISRMFTGLNIHDLIAFAIARPLWLLIVALGLELHSIRHDDYNWLKNRFAALPWYVKFVIFAATVQLVINFSSLNVQPFIYTQF